MDKIEDNKPIFHQYWQAPTPLGWKQLQGKIGQLIIAKDGGYNIVMLVFEDGVRVILGEFSTLTQATEE